MNSSYGSGGMNTEKHHKVQMMNRKQTERAIRSNAFMDEQKISEDSYIVQMNPKHCSYRDFYNENAKYFFPTIKGDVYDEKKILRLAIERQGTAISESPKFTPKQITWVNILAVSNKQVGRQAIKKIIFLLCLESLTR
ncbi:MAG: hypothetical protein EZS28_014193 [Streblomastix strix]|uniref:Uncharacterized protein n=1 Tax=Streblomastix strix TaxID=222440 RepID=A0A5J4W679_9EUKA|nr:MAG: hypothetical protein EZS28_014193 [Streblomastix strix]